MRKVGLLLLALAVVAGMSLAVPMAKGERDGNPYSNKIYPVTKDQGDSVLADVHLNSCYISSVRAIDLDPAAGAASLIFRSSDGLLYSLTSLDNGANYTRQGPLVAGGVRYPSAMADAANQLPFAFYNRGFGAANSGAAVVWDDMGYGGGLWSSETFVDTLGRTNTLAAYYVVLGTKGTSGRIHCLGNYWGDFTPDAAFYFNSDDGGYTWNVQTPRVGNLMYYDLNGTDDSLEIFGGGPVVHDPVVAGYVNQVQIFSTLSGETLMVGSCGLENELPETGLKFWYRMSYDGGDNWTPFAYAPDAGNLGWPSISYDLGIALDKEGYPHFITWLFMDTTAAGGYGPNTGLVDYHQTAGGWVSTLIHATDEAGTVFPSFANAGLDPDGNIVISYRDNEELNATMNIWYAYTLDNGATWTKEQVTSDNGGYDYPHLPYRIGAAGTQFPIFYQRGNTGFISWATYQGVQGGPATPTRQSFVLSQNRPNPVRTNTEISFNLAKAGDYSLKIYNVAGQTVKEFRGQGQTGANSVSWNAGNATNGIYFYKLTSGGSSATKRMVVVK